MGCLIIVLLASFVTALGIAGVKFAIPVLVDADPVVLVVSVIIAIIITLLIANAVGSRIGRWYR